jgi:hypothetical protein
MYHELNAKLHPVWSRNFCTSIDMITAYGILIYANTCHVATKHTPAHEATISPSSLPLLTCPLPLLDFNGNGAQ